MLKQELQYGTTKIKYSLVFDDRKTLGIKVHPDKSVHVVAPADTSLEKIEEKVRSKAAWIIRQQDFFMSFHPMTPPRKYVSGETHLYLGRQYRLKVKESDQPSVKLQSGNIVVATKDKTDRKKVEQQLRSWYKSKAEIHFNKLFEEQLPVAKTFYSGTPTLKYRWMDKRWGSCDSKAQVHLNLELIKAPKRCIKYVIVHELCHLVHLNHSTAFFELLEKLLPNWRETKDKLEKIMV
ncbi:MAG: M48 family metallopeptidase [Bacteroidota bacterium]